MTPKFSEISEGVRRLIVKLREERKSLPEVAKVVKRSHVAVNKVIDKYVTTGSMNNSILPGRPKKLSDADVRFVTRCVKNVPRTSAAKLATELSKIN